MRASSSGDGARRSCPRSTRPSALAVWQAPASAPRSCISGRRRRACWPRSARSASPPSRWRAGRSGAANAGTLQVSAGLARAGVFRPRDDRVPAVSGRRGDHRLERRLSRLDRRFDDVRLRRNRDVFDRNRDRKTVRRPRRRPIRANVRRVGGRTGCAAGFALAAGSLHIASLLVAYRWSGRALRTSCRRVQRQRGFGSSPGQGIATVATGATLDCSPGRLRRGDRDMGKPSIGFRGAGGDGLRGGADFDLRDLVRTRRPRLSTPHSRDRRWPYRWRRDIRHR